MSSKKSRIAAPWRLGVFCVLLSLLGGTHHTAWCSASAGAVATNDTHEKTPAFWAGVFKRTVSKIKLSLHWVCL
jgi:hypothetical protein